MEIGPSSSSGFETDLSWGFSESGRAHHLLKANLGGSRIDEPFQFRENDPTTTVDDSVAFASL